MIGMQTVGFICYRILKVEGFTAVMARVLVVRVWFYGGQRLHSLLCSEV